MPRFTPVRLLSILLALEMSPSPPNAGKAWAGADLRERMRAIGDRPLTSRRSHLIPKPFHGRWAHVAADCRARGFSAILASSILTIEATRLRNGKAALGVIDVLEAPDNPQQIVVSAYHLRPGRVVHSLEQFTLSGDGHALAWWSVNSAAGPAAPLYRCG